MNLLKLYGPVLAEQVQRKNGFRAVVIVPVWPLMNLDGKNRYVAALLHLPQLSAELGPEVEIVCVESCPSFLKLLLERRVRAVVSVGLSLPEEIRQGVVVPSRARGVRWCSLGYLYEELLEVLLHGLSALDDWDVATTFSQAPVDRLAELLSERGIPAVECVKKFRPIGFVECDQVASFDRSALREKYGLPDDRPVICFATAPTFETFRTSQAMRWLFRCAWFRDPRLARAAGRLWRSRWPAMDYLAGYSNILACLRRFADRYGAIIVAKTRDKHRDPAYVGRGVDFLLSDEAYFPFRTLELLFLSDLYVGISSSTAFEGAFVGRRMRTIVPFPPEAYEHPLFLELKRDFFYASPGLWNARGLSDLSRTYVAGDWEAFEEWATNGALETRVDTGVRNAVVNRVIGFDDYKSSSRFMDLVEDAIGSIQS